MLAGEGATGRVQEVAKAECRVHDLFAKRGVVLRREGQGTVESVSSTGEVEQGLVDFCRVVLDGNSELRWEGLVPKHKFGHW